MIVELIGVLDDGSQRTLKLPASTRAFLRVPRGGVFTLRLAVFRADGSPFDLKAASASLVWTIKKRTTDAVPPGVQATVAFPGGAVAGDPTNVARLTLASTALHNVASGRYVYDIWLTAAGPPVLNEAVVPMSPMQIDETVRTAP